MRNNLRPKIDSSGFITMIVVLIAVLVAVIWFAYVRVHKASQ